MQIAPNPFPHRVVECFVAHPERGGTTWVALATVGDQQGVFATTGSRAAVSAAASTLGNTALTVVPLRSAAMRTGTCSRERPRFFALPPRRRALRPSPRAPFPALQNVGLVRFHDPLEHSESLRAAARNR